MKRTILFLIGLSFRRGPMRSSVFARIRNHLSERADRAQRVRLAGRGKRQVTEDNVQKKLGEGLWQTASKLRTFRQDILDVKQDTAVSLAVLEEGTSPALFALRLKIADRKISEIETLVQGARISRLWRNCHGSVIKVADSLYRPSGLDSYRLYAVQLTQFSFFGFHLRRLYHATP